MFSSRFTLVALLILAACGGSGSGSSAKGPSGTTQTGASGTTSSADESSPPGPPTDIDCGDFTTCAVASDGLLRCWGRDKAGELGDGSGGGAARPKRAIVPGLGKVKRVALASQFGCALLDDKKVKCWGTGRIANDGKSVEGARPTQVAALDDVEELAASGAIACARNPKGVVCWGADEATIGTPPSGAFKQIATGFTHACALDQTGAVICWGQGEWGGKGSFANPPVNGALQVVTGDRHACVVTKAKGVQCWGMNDAGQLGVKSDVEPHKKLVTVPALSNVAKLVAGDASTCATLGDGSVRCWGSNGEGELGLGKRSPDERPARVSALSDPDEICLASAHGCALTKSGKLLCWGANAFGQLGDGTKERHALPTAVIW
jgi:alpha-tubulin suppressor-like RCC1 family protein